MISRYSEQPPQLESLAWKFPCITAARIRLFVQSPLNKRLHTRQHCCGNIVPVALAPSAWPRTTARNSEAMEATLPLSQSSYKHVGRLAKRRKQHRAHLPPNIERESIASSVAIDFACCSASRPSLSRRIGLQRPTARSAPRHCPSIVSSVSVIRGPSRASQAKRQLYNASGIPSEMIDSKRCSLQGSAAAIVPGAPFRENASRTSAVD